MIENESLERKIYNIKKKISRESWLILKWLMKMKIEIEFLLILKK